MQQPQQQEKSTDPYFSAAELAGLPGMPGSERGVRWQAEAAGWSFRKRTGRGGGREYPLHCLPVPARDALAEQLVGKAPVALTVVQNSPLPAAVPAKSAELLDWQRARAEARTAILVEVKRLAPSLGTSRAVRAVVSGARAGTLPERLQRMVLIANARSGADGKRSISEQSVYRWLAEDKKGFAALAPKASRAAAAPPAWFLDFLAQFQKPQKPSVAQAIKKITRPGETEPNASTARYWLKKMSVVDAARGRMGPRELKSIKPFVRRDSSHLWPGDVYTADGHTFDAEVAHPAHGRAFRPEITAVIDIATRRLVGWSAGLNESTWAVLDAQRNAIENCGIPALWYVDNGSGYVNAVQEDLVVGFAERVGMTITNSLPYNSQSRGVMERSHRTIWVRAAKRLPTYIGAAMDPEAKQKVFRLTRRDIRITGTSPLLMPWAQFLEFCRVEADDYNNHPHRSLAKIRDEATGKLRHMTPMEAWNAALAENWQPTMVPPQEIDDLLRPYKLCTVSRGEVRLFNNLYFDQALAAYHGEKVQVGYDIHDASRVWVRDAGRRLICVARFEANSRAYFPQTVIDQAKEKRAQGRIARAEARIEEAEAELHPAPFLEHLPADVIEQSVPTLDRADARLENVVELQGMRRPMFDTDADKFRWLSARDGEVNEEDERWLAWYRETEEWFDLFGVGSKARESEEF